MADQGKKKREFGTTLEPVNKKKARTMVKSSPAIAEPIIDLFEFEDNGQSEYENPGDDEEIEYQAEDSELLETGARRGDGRLTSQTKSTAERDNLGGLIDRAAIQRTLQSPCCLRCAKEVSQFPDLVCWTDLNRRKCQACIRKKKECEKVG